MKEYVFAGQSEVSTSALTWFIRYIYYRQFLDNVIINKTKVLLPQTWVLDPLVLLLPNLK